MTKKFQKLCDYFQVNLPMNLDSSKEKEETDKLQEMKKYLTFTISDENISVSFVQKKI